MKRTIKRIAPLQAGKMLGVLYACLGLIFLPIFMLAAAAGAFAHMRKELKLHRLRQLQPWPVSCSGWAS
jgi:hypothetical protein